MFKWLTSLFSPGPKVETPEPPAQKFDPLPAIHLDWLNSDALDDAFRSVGNARGKTVTLSWKTIGTLKSPTGQIYASDPTGIAIENDPFFQTVPPGEYEVRICIAEFENKDTRIVLAKLVTSSAAPVSWKLALTETQDPGGLTEGQFYGYGVDGGTGCFLDAASLQLVNTLLDTDFPDGTMGFELLTKALEETYESTRSWADYALDESGQNIIMFSTGWGDGTYPTYIGYDATGTVTSFVTDFLVLDILGDVPQQ